MADTKISALPAVTAPAATDEFSVNQGGTSKKMTLAQITTRGGGSVRHDATGTAFGLAIGDFFPSTLSLDAASTYEIECLAYFLKTTAGTVIWTWTFGSAPIVATSSYEATPITGFTTTTITGTPLFAQATAEAVAAMAHAVSGSLTTAVRHTFKFYVKVRTNAGTTIQLRATQSAGTLTPQQGSYMRAIKIV
jgi:hypothetical protein